MLCFALLCHEMPCQLEVSFCFATNVHALSVLPSCPHQGRETRGGRERLAASRASHARHGPPAARRQRSKSQPRLENNVQEQRRRLPTGCRRYVPMLPLQYSAARAGRPAGQASSATARVHHYLHADRGGGGPGVQRPSPSPAIMDDSRRRHLLRGSSPPLHHPAAHVYLTAKSLTVQTLMIPGARTAYTLPPTVFHFSFSVLSALCHAHVHSLTRSPASM